jgi:hypothetical protein
MGGEVAVAHQRADLEAAVIRARDPVEALQPVDVDEARRRHRLDLHQVEEVGATGDESGSVGCRRDRLVDASGAGVVEGPHRRALARMAATMLE